jgi:hypothetical protein
VLGSVADDGLVARKQRLAPRPGDAGDAALSNWDSFPLDHRPWLEAVDEFASKSLTSRQRTNKRAVATPTNKRMLLSQEKGAHHATQSNPLLFGPMRGTQLHTRCRPSRRRPANSDERN